MPSPEDAVRQAYLAYARGDLATALSYVGPDLEWTYLDPSVEVPEPQVCHGRNELKAALKRQAAQDVRSELEEVVGLGDRALVVMRQPIDDARRAFQTDDRNFIVVTVRKGRIELCVPAAIAKRPR